ncbi:hypothetical protein AM587_10003762 [Phytophthora nicotianae]|uniref:Uncharacterized protein n=1 Tax=Phytophthora nicotianae TaxID=4792 RepID=A0A0W8C4G4_PHYNI|nr:hypothetical protein AM587_10003762 [Phytophthora nicotianae]
MWRVESVRREIEEREVDKHASKCKVDSVKSAKNVENTNTVESVGSTENAEGVDTMASSEKYFDEYKLRERANQHIARSMQALAISTKVDQVCPGKLDKNLNKQGLKNNVVIAINPKLWKSRGQQRSTTSRVAVHNLGVDGYPRMVLENIIDRRLTRLMQQMLQIARADNKMCQVFILDVHCEESRTWISPVARLTILRIDALVDWFD